MRLYIVLIAALFVFSACDDIADSENQTPEFFYPALEDLTEEIIFVRESDFQVKPAFAWDKHTDGNLTYTEGSLLGMHDENQLFLNGERFNSQISYACANSKINGLEMCNPGNTKCNYEEYYMTGAWNLTGRVKKPKYFEWEFIDLNKSKKFILKFDELPKPAKITSYETALHLNAINNIQFQKDNESDSVFFQLVKVPKSNFEAENQRNSSALSYPFLSKENHFEIHGKDLFPNNYSIPTNQDSVFINIVTVKRIIKEINGALIGFTYYVNDPKPVLLQ